MKQQPKSAVKKGWLWLILGLYLLIGAGYSVITPLFEAPDEHHHFFNALNIRQTGELPRSDQNPGLARQEAAQPPLYYLLAALIIAPVDVGDAEDALWPNPYVQLGNANTPDNANVFIHLATERNFPWQGMALAVHLVRFLSVLLGLGTLIFLYQSAQLIWPDTPQNGLLATALVAFLPQFGFLHGSVSNDPLMILVATAVLYQLLFLWQVRVTNGRLLVLGITLGLGLLAKTTGILLLAWAVGWLVLRQSWQKKRLVWQATVPVVLPALLVGGWWLVRNWLLYGDVTAVNQFVALAGGNRAYSLGQVLADLDRVWLSFIAFFGWMTVRPPIWIHWLWGGIVALAVVGGAWQLRGWRNSSRARSLLWLVLGSWFGLVFVGWVQFTRQTSADQGRLLFPALAAVVQLLVAGLSGWRQRWLFPLLAMVALLTTLYSLGIVIPSALGSPQPIATTLSELEMVETAVLNQPVGEGIELLAAHIEQTAAHPGDYVGITLTWRADAIPTEPPTLVIELFGREQELVGKLLSYHGNGRLPANLWQPNQIYQDSFWVQLSPEMSTPTLVRPFVHLLDGTDRTALPPFKVTSRTQPAAQTAVATLGDGIELVGVQLSQETAVVGDQIGITLMWQIISPPQQQLTTFIHLGEQTQPPLAQADGIPLNGDYPTDFWEAGEQFTDTYRLILPPELPSGSYPLYVGLYNSETAVRLPVSINNQAQPFAAYQVGFLTITSPNR
ncbi:glycosyltransferase family 39 protein [Candidatus Leptofilum sp.]|uniref:glycosyltransferase family 39 protein n=1 Tax=Candidatus Leptofilum sp. TaxID=3241576 RepID=UPI003B5B48DB